MIGTALSQEVVILPTQPDAIPDAVSGPIHVPTPTPEPTPITITQQSGETTTVYPLGNGNYFIAK